MKNITIKEVPFGIASRVGNIIYVNKYLKKFNTTLYDAVLLHEYSHTSGFSKKDFDLDIYNDQIKGLKGEYYKFIFLHPSSLSEFLPLWKYKGQWQFNPTLTLFYGLVLLLGGLIWFIL